MRVEVKTFVDINVGDVVRHDHDEKCDFIGYITRVGCDHSYILWSDGTTCEWSNTAIASRLTGENKYDILKPLLANAEMEE